MDPKRFSLIKEHDKHFQVHDSKDNTHFDIAKKGIHPATQIRIMKLQKFDEGGSVLDIEKRLRSDYQGEDKIEEPNAVTDPTIQQQDAPVPEAPLPAIINGPMSEGAATPPTIPGQSQSPNTAEMPQQMPGGGFLGPGKTQDTMKQFQNNQGLEERGLVAKGQAELEAGNQTAQVYQDAQTKLQTFFDNSQKIAAVQDAKNEKLAQDVASSKVDPKNYVHSMSTSQKIGNAIALIIGGIGAGLTHGPNLAYQSLQKAIEDDVQSQKDNIGTKKSLLSENLAKYKDMRMAEHATMMQMNAMTQGQIAQIAAKYGGQIGQAGTQAALGQLKNTNLVQSQALQEKVYDSQIKQHLAGGDVSKDNPLDYVKHVVPPEKQKEVADEIGKAQYASQQHDYLMKLYDQASKEQTVMGRLGGLKGESPALVSLQNAMLPLLRDKEGRIMEFEFDKLKQQLPGMARTGAYDKTLKQGFENFIQDKKVAPLAKSQGIDISRFDSTKTTPVSDIKTVNGIQYKRGPNGEAIRVK